MADIKIPEFMKKEDGETRAAKDRKDLESQHESELRSFQQSLKKAEKEIGYKDQEIRHFKNMASGGAE